MSGLKLKLAIIILLAATSTKAETSFVSIDCSESTCSPNFNVTDNFQRNTYNAIDVGFNQSNMMISSGAGKKPRDLKININNGEFPDGEIVPGYSVNADLSSTTQMADSGNLVLMGDNFKSISIKLNGYSGKAGKNASELCVENVKADLYGSDSNGFFAALRLNNPTISESACQIDDINYLQTNKFTCDNGFSEVVTTNSVYTVNVQRIPRINRCQTSVTYNVCIKRIVELSCKWDIYVKSTNQVKEFSTTLIGEMPENRYYFLRNTLTNSQICDSYVARDITNSSYIPPTGVNPYIDNPDQKGGCSAWTCEWRTNPQVSVNLSSPGLLETGELAQGSKWKLKQMAPGESCNTSNIFSPLGDDGDGGFWSNYKTVSVNYVAYDLKDALCNPADLVTFSGGNKIESYPANDLDPNKKAVWFYTGQTQEPDFGTEVVQCELGNCSVTNIVSDLTKSLDTISPQSGEDGTKQGSGYILIYDTETISIQNKLGVAGAGGRNDISNNTTVRVCAKIKDAQSEGLFSDYSRNPTVSFSRYNWTSIKTNSSGNPGNQPISSNGQIVVWKKLDTSVREVLRDILFNKN